MVDAPPPVPAFARPAGGLLDAKPMALAMPDLRFSKLDLDIDMTGFQGGPESRPGSVVQPDEKRRSKMAFLGFSNSKGADELQVPRLAMASSRSASTTSLAEPARSPLTQSSSYTASTLPRSHKVQDQDRKKLVASATEAMNLDVPVKAPVKPQVMPRASSALALVEGTGSVALKSRKDLKKEEKEKAALEKERAAKEKDRAKEAAKAAKKEKELSRRMSKADLKKKDNSSTVAGAAVSVAGQASAAERASAPAAAASVPKGAAPRPEQRRALESMTNVPSAKPKGPAPASQSSHGVSKRRNGSPSGGRPPSAPPSHKPPPAPVSGSASAKNSQSKPALPLQGAQNKPSSEKLAREGAGKDKVEPFQFPKSSSSAPVPARSQSAIPAADGVARPIVSRGQTQAPERKPNQGSSVRAMFGGPLNMSPTTKSTPSFDTVGRPLKSPSRSQPQSNARTSSDEGGTSTTADAPSIESNTSYEGPSPDSPRSNEDFHERFVDASQTFVQRPRPRRDEEREERAQSRLSTTLDVELYRAVQGSEDQHQRKESKDSMDRFSALLMASRPGGAADRAAERAAETALANSNADLQKQHYLSNGKVFSARPAPPPPQPVKRVREMAPIPKKRRVVRPELVDAGVGWKCLGVGDVDVVNVHERLVTETVLRPKPVEHKEEGENEENEEASEEAAKSEEASGGEKTAPTRQEEPAIEYEEEHVQVRYSDLFELLWTSTTPDVISRLISHLDIPDLKALRQASHSIRFILNVADNREMILNKYLACVGYRTWTYTKGVAGSYRNGVRTAPANTTKDPCPLSFNDCEAFLLSQDLLPEYAAVGQEYAANPDQMDPRMPRLARASTRAYNRVLTRLRLQPIFKVPGPASSATTAIRTLPSEGSSPVVDSKSNMGPAVDASTGLGDLPKHNSYFRLAPSPTTPTEPLPSAPSASGSPVLDSKTEGPNEASALSPTVTSSSAVAALSAPSLVSPWKPGRAALYRIWVPASDASGWLSDEELSQCETELFRAGVWNFLRRGDVIWDTAVGESMNEGKYLFDGHYLRDLSYAHDVAGHLPSWLNCMLYSPSYWHNLIKSSSPRPIIYFDISPWKDQILNSLRLVQDQVESYSQTGSRYRIAKWLYRSAANVTSGQIISKMSGGLEIVDDGWNGRIVVETEGTAEHAKSLISRCAGPNATPKAKAELLATVMGDVSAANKMMNTSNTNGLTQAVGPSPALSTAGIEVQNSAWMIMRERSRPGLIWIKLVVDKA